MSRLAASDAGASQFSAQQEWNVGLDEVGPDGLLGLDRLREQLLALASWLGAKAVGRKVVPLKVDNVQLLAPVRAHQRLIVTTAVERRSATGAVVSVVVSRPQAGQEVRQLVALGIVSLGISDAGPRWVEPRGLQ
ncbi:hypothetical protein [Hyalangium rubrum]|uniref:Uncharacterized protein n=1 Tax=Hyalangium rubrum TaxID=3103134 RepID=A0ABU5H549_9BACT|nr:hypothetical protein [Hyalangium sp. s54d21]MDY7228247.1 hypothetical protein [Hyalangium sp. s54d21]